MNAVAVAIVVAGIALSISIGAAAGFGLRSVVLLGIIVAVGALVVAIVAKSKTGTIGPASCADCGGLISPNAPFCKHCGAPTGR